MSSCFCNKCGANLLIPIPQVRIEIQYYNKAGEAENQRVFWFCEKCANFLEAWIKNESIR